MQVSWAHVDPGPCSIHGVFTFQPNTDLNQIKHEKNQVCLNNLLQVCNNEPELEDVHVWRTKSPQHVSKKKNGGNSNSKPKMPVGPVGAVKKKKRRNGRSFLPRRKF